MTPSPDQSRREFLKAAVATGSASALSACLDRDGETVWARHEPSGQREATSIDSDGRFSVALRFVDVDPGDTVVVETPGYVVEAPLRQLTDTTVTADMA
jgi:hypothetical protein